MDDRYRALVDGITDYAILNAGTRVRKDGTRFWAHVVIDAIRDRNGDRLGFYLDNPTCVRAL
ncbi:hypothetical protein BMW22_28475 (plasmid) [Rhizobium leguminosarum]|uniref:PAS domain-containing protein n=1 Tax=Rhizobium leguminosarum TaxID=384 RepID=A0A1L3ZIE7_RHILE|nr:hypothetical protein BMW22_28475 [Rhizobium leguminosarum]